MLDRIDMDVVRMRGKVRVIPERVLPKSTLPARVEFRLLGRWKPMDGPSQS